MFIYLYFFFQSDFSDDEALMAMPLPSPSVNVTPVASGFLELLNSPQTSLTPLVNLTPLTAEDCPSTPSLPPVSRAALLSQSASAASPSQR